MFRNFIWDFDGMLFNSYPHITSAFIKMMGEYGKYVDYNEAKSLFEISFGVAFEKYKTTEEQKVIFRKYEHNFELEPIAVPFENTIYTLKKIVENGGKNFLYTHRGASVHYYLKKYDIYSLFTDYVTSENNFPAKPAPDAVEYIVKNNSLNKNETIMIGDREIDVMAGKNAGVYGCLYSLKEKETSADFIIKDIIDILTL